VANIIMALDFNNNFLLSDNVFKFNSYVRKILWKNWCGDYLLIKIGSNTINFKKEKVSN